MLKRSTVILTLLLVPGVASARHHRSSSRSVDAGIADAGTPDAGGVDAGVPGAGAASPVAAPSEELALFKLDEEVEVGGAGGKAHSSVASSALANGRLIPPHKIAGPDPDYTQQAFDHEIEGDMAVECIVGANGHVSKCKALKSLPFMTNAVIDALEARTYAPAQLDGKPIDVDYTFHLHFKLPQ